MQIIIKGSRSDLVRRQKACINEVNKNGVGNPKNKEVMRDMQRWSEEGGLMKEPKDQRARVLMSSDRLMLDPTKSKNELS